MTRYKGAYENYWTVVPGSDSVGIEQLQSLSKVLRQENPPLQALVVKAAEISDKRVFEFFVHQLKNASWIPTEERRVVLEQALIKAAQSVVGEYVGLSRFRSHSIDKVACLCAITGDLALSSDKVKEALVFAAAANEGPAVRYLCSLKGDRAPTKETLAFAAKEFKEAAKEFTKTHPTYAQYRDADPYSARNTLAAQLFFKNHPPQSGSYWYGKDLSTMTLADIVKHASGVNDAALFFGYSGKNTAKILREAYGVVVKSGSYENTRRFDSGVDDTLVRLGSVILEKMEQVPVLHQ